VSGVLFFVQDIIMLAKRWYSKQFVPEINRGVTSREDNSVLVYEWQCRCEKAILQHKQVNVKARMSDGTTVEWVW